MFGLDWTFTPKRISKQINVVKINVGENKVTKKRKVLQRNNVNFEKGKNDTKSPIGCFNKAIAPVIVVSQIFGLMPIQGIYSSNVNDLKFSWKSPRTLYNIILVSIIFFRLISEAHSYVENSSTNYITDFIISMPLSFIISIKSITLARRWPSLMKKWYDVEVSLAKYQFKNASQALIRKGRVMAAILVLNVLSICATLIGKDIREVTECYDEPERLDAFIRISAPEIIFLTKDASFLAVAVAIAGRLQHIVLFNFMNYFIMVICLGLISQFKMLNENLLAAKGRIMPLSYWATIRVDYERLVDLCNAVDDEFCFFVAIQLLFEVYFITSRFLRSFKSMDSITANIRVWVFLCINFVSCFGKMFLGSKINEESKRPLKVLRAVPSETWNIEVQRFADDVATNTVALSCLKVFFITRRGILSVFATLVTYEIILSQFQIQSTFTRCGKKN